MRPKSSAPLLGMDKWKAATWGNPRAALRAAIEAVEALGILVLQSRDVAISEMRAFSLSEWPNPVMVLNGSDWPRPKLFSLLHEMCHVGLNASSLCDLHEVSPKQRRAEDRVEHYCNEVAASVLMPRAAVLADPLVQRTGSGDAWTLDELAGLSQRFGASSEAVLLRLVALGLATWDLYWQRKPELEQEYAEARQREKERQQAAEGGPSYFVIKARNLGYAYINSVLDAFQARAISSFDVADYLDVRYDQVAKLEKAALR
jgi:Zn-dependent peptidase ImmA (M78 family)